jgi:replicative DNA helicase
MVKKNINDLINFVHDVDQKLFRDVKDLSTMDQEILNKFISLKENLENLENLDNFENFENFETIIDTIASETNRKNSEIIEKLNYFRKLNII